MLASAIADPVTGSGTMLGEVLAPLHEQWVAALQRVVAPALLGTSDIWDRWAAVRYLGDEFAPLLEQERKLVRELPRLDPVAFERIEAGYQGLQQLRGEIDEAGRRHHTGGIVMRLLRGFLDLLADWFVAVEHATSDVPLATLPADAVGIVTALEEQAGERGV